MQREALKNIEPLARELFKFEVLAPCGRHANEVIRPYPLACPWYCARIWANPPPSKGCVNAESMAFLLILLLLFQRPHLRRHPRKRRLAK